MSNDKISAFYIMTEPEKMGYPYIESITSVLSFADEVVLVMGRDEPASEKKIDQLARSIPRQKSVKIVKTHAWPEFGWNYNIMRDHIQRGLDECTHDLCLKVDCDYVFRDQHCDEIRSAIQIHAQDNHLVTFGRVNFSCLGKADYQPAIDHTPCYVINKRALRDDGIECAISNESGSNQPIFMKDERVLDVSSGKDLKVLPLSPMLPDSLESWVYHYLVICPVNYSYTFMTASRIAKTWSEWHRAIHLRFGNLRMPNFDLDDMHQSIKNFAAYHFQAKIPSLGHCRDWDEIRGIILGSSGDTLADMVNRGILHCNDRGEPQVSGAMTMQLVDHPACMRHVLQGISSDKWGFNNFNLPEPPSRGLTHEGAAAIYEKWLGDIGSYLNE
tara:strand:- start:2623 stop:3780 length:1158 start_codon:yes stop_codon:yes gene_type:complete